MLNYYGQTKEAFETIKPLIREGDKHNMMVVALMTSIILVMLCFVSMYLSFANMFTVVYRKYALSTCLFTFVAWRMKKFYRLEVYCLVGLLFGLGSALSVLIPDQPATIFPVFLTIVPLLFTDDYLSMTGMSMAFTVVYILRVSVLKTPEAASVAIYNIIILLIISTIIRYLIQRQNVAGLLVKIENYKLVNQLTHDVQYDTLTNLLNRKALEHHIIEDEQLLIKEEYQVLGILDIDNFKGVNDTYGHHQGDRILKELSAILTQNLRESDIIGRLGGDEFIFCLADRGGVGSVDLEVELLIKEINKITFKGKQKLEVSIGIVYLTGERLTFMEAYKKADMALYEAKSNGKNRVSVCS